MNDDLIRRARIALLKHYDEPFEPSLAEVREHDGRQYVVLEGEGQRVVYRVQPRPKDGATMLRKMARPPDEILGRGEIKMRSIE